MTCAHLATIRSPGRIRSSDILSQAFDSFERAASPDGALIDGVGKIAGRRVRVFAQQKPKTRTAKEAASVNFGMMTAVGYWHVVRELERTAAEKLPVVTLIDTPGADPSTQGIEGTEQLLAWAISACISSFIAYPGPIVSTIIGEGGSGGALALQVADRRMMVSDALYSVISPESCAAILFRDATKREDALSILRTTAGDALGGQTIDEIVPWPEEVALHNHALASTSLKDRIVRALDAVAALSEEERIERRVRQLFACGDMKSEERRTSPDDAPMGMRPLDPRRLRAEPDIKKMRPLSATDAQTAYVADAPVPSGRASIVDTGEWSMATTGEYRALGTGEWRAMEREMLEENATPTLVCPRGEGGCGAACTKEAFRAAHWSCPNCGRGERLTSEQWVGVLCDEGSFVEAYPDLDLSDLAHGGYDTPHYKALRKKAQEKHGVREAVRVGVATIQGRPCTVAVSDFRFFGGSLGAVYGEKFRRIAEFSMHERLPFVALTCSGGARMQEGTVALTQMAKTNAALLRLRAEGLPFVSILADPCTGGALGSFATCASVVLAEPQALVAFAGPRVMSLNGMQENVRAMLSNNVATYGGIDEIVPRIRMASRVGRYLDVSVGGRPSARLAQRNAEKWLSSLSLRMTVLFDEADASRAPAAIHEVQASVVRGLASFALETIPQFLERASRSEDHRVRANAIEALAEFPRTDPLIRRALSDPHHRVRMSAVQALLARSPGDDMASRALTAALASTDEFERKAAEYAVEAIRKLGVRGA